MSPSQPDHDKYVYVAVQMDPKQVEAGIPAHHALHKRAESVAREVEMQFVGRVGELPDYFQFAIPKSEIILKRDGLNAEQDEASFIEELVTNRLEAHPHIIWAEQQIPKKRLHKRDPPVADHFYQRRLWTGETSLGIADPLFTKQWHLKGNDINVTGIWNQGSYDFNDHVALPKPRMPEDRHGTRCAGEVAAKRNDVCGVGIAFKAKVAGIRILSGLNHIYSCSWGPPDDGRSMDAPPRIVKDAVTNGIVNGRSGLGSVFSTSNFDGYTNSIYTITVAAIDRKNQHPVYSEECSANMVSMYSSGSGYSIVTTDWGAGPCTEGHGGTSAAAPIVSGILALVLSIRPDLTWRDVQRLAVQTAIPINLEDPSWEKTTISGRKFMDSYAIVEAAKTWKLVNPQANFTTGPVKVDKVIPEGEGNARGVFKVEEKHVADMLRLEHITVTVNINHTRRGDVNVKLISPSNIVSYLGVKRPGDADHGGFKNWTFMTVKHWEENPVGEWQVIVHDDEKNQQNGTFNYFWMSFWGESKHEGPKSTTSTINISPTDIPSLESSLLPTILPTNKKWVYLAKLQQYICFRTHSGYKEVETPNEGSDDENSMPMRSFA
ncbi:peptidase S8/S53 domain-containing protein [Chytridium lagenaria]|nr:peptidase S8/S53 domain-containing protein [Chytridium lagenaria]